MSTESTSQQLSARPARPVFAVLALGSNLGVSVDTLASAVAQLAAADGVEVTSESPLVLSAAVGGPADQPDYVNQVIEVRTELAPLELLALAQEIEQAHHRERIVRWGPRTLDIDVITYGELSSDDEELTLPHPRAAERGFVLIPWSWMDPGAFVAGKSVFELADVAADRDTVRPYRAPEVLAVAEAGAVVGQFAEVDGLEVRGAKAQGGPSA